MGDLCAKKSGWKIFETVDNVSGYYYGGDWYDGVKIFGGCPHLSTGNFCISALLSGFDYVESEAVDKDLLTDQHMVDELGLFRFTLEKAGHPNCRIFQKAVANHVEGPESERIFYTGNKEKLRDHCIATTEISNISSKYEIINRFTTVIDNEEGKIIEYKSEISQRDTKNKIAEYNSYNYVPPKSKPQSRIRNCPDTAEAPSAKVAYILRPTAQQQ